MKLKYNIINQVPPGKKPKIYKVVDFSHALNYVRKSLSNEGNFPSIQKIELFMDDDEKPENQEPFLMYKAPTYESIMTDEGNYAFNFKNKKADAYFHKDLFPKPIPDFNDYRVRTDWERDAWNALTDGQYGDYDGQDIGDWMESHGY